jgi:hypothetical protein
MFALFVVWTLVFILVPFLLFPALRIVERSFKSHDQSKGHGPARRNITIRGKGLQTKPSQDVNTLYDLLRLGLKRFPANQQVTYILIEAVWPANPH